MEENNRQRARKILFLSRYYQNTMEWGEIDFSRKRLRSSNWKTACWIWISHFERQLHASNGLSCSGIKSRQNNPVSYTHLRAHETRHDLVCRLLLEKKK